MWEWFKGLFVRDERCLFRYFDGVKKRAIDPVATYRLLWTTGDCDLLADSTTARNPLLADGTPFYPIAEVYAAEDRLRAMTRKIFGVQEWAEGRPGLTVDETDALLNSFMAFCADLKKKRNPSRTPSPPTASTVPPSSSDTTATADPGFPVGVDPDYCCSRTESSVGVPTGP